MFTGGCMCGQVRYEVHGPLRDVIACHCRQCRRVSSHYVAATAAHPKDLTITCGHGLSWYQGTRSIRRGFCRLCGSTLFFDHGPGQPTGIAAGSLDDAGDLKLAVHIWTEEAGGYYDVPDDAPRCTSAEWRAGGLWDPLSWTDGGAAGGIKGT